MTHDFDPLLKFCRHCGIALAEVYVDENLNCRGFCLNVPEPRMADEGPVRAFAWSRYRLLQTGQSRFNFLEDMFS